MSQGWHHLQTGKKERIQSGKYKLTYNVAFFLNNKIHNITQNCLKNVIVYIILGNSFSHEKSQIILNYFLLYNFL